MASLEKKIRDNQDKDFIYRNTGKIPKHRCPDCHRFTVWVTNDNQKNQCLMCMLKRQEEKNDG